MRIAVCEDAKIDMQMLKTALTEAYRQLEAEVETDFYSSGEDLIAAAEAGTEYDFCLLDVYMEGMTGVETAGRLRELLPDVQLAFLTSSRDFMLEAFDLNAVHYLIKPVDKAALKTCLERFFQRVRAPIRMLEIRSGQKSWEFPAQKVQKIMSGNKGVDVYLAGAAEPTHLPISFAETEKQLDSELFLKISRGYLVQMSFILNISRDECRLRDGSTVLLSRKEKSEIRRKYNDYLFRK